MYSRRAFDFSIIALSDATEHEIKRIKDNDNQKNHALKKELEELENNSSSYWHWRRINGKTYFWELVNGKQMGISRDADRIHMLARRDFLRLRLSDKRYHSYDQWCNELLALLEIYLSIGLDIKRVVLTQNQYNWAESPQSCNRIYPEGLKFETNCGINVRSKSEQSIANVFEEFYIPYRYEPEMNIANRVFYPDFVIMTECGRKIIIEHLGRMDLSEYIKSNVDKLAAYASAGLVIGRDVFLSFEHNTRNRQSILDILYRVMSV